MSDARLPENIARQIAEAESRERELWATYSAAAHDWNEARENADFLRRKWLIQDCAIVGCVYSAEPESGLCAVHKLDARKQISADRDDRLGARDRGELR